MDKKQGTKQREQRTLGDCWQWKANGQCSKGDNCIFRHDINKRAKKDTIESVSESSTNVGERTGQPVVDQANQKSSQKPMKRKPR